ncbi:MAG: hypothetical protein JW819_13495, partial [Candidatus Krumholzibacteriota bacterium]|nr:hypothetical protein [Candidatus Krumholzibacteriota bacterium]
MDRGSLSWKRLLGIAASIALLVARPAGAITWHVPDDYAAIQSAIDAAGNGDTVLVAPGTYDGYHNHDLDLEGKNLRVIGAGGSSVTTIECGGNYRGLIVIDNPYPTVLIQGFTFSNCHCAESGTAAGGAIRVVNASPTLRDLRFVACTTTSWGGGVHLYHAQGCTLENIDIRGCSADVNGG